ncbi:TAXI family TRAP transporter solute-binding subunit [Halomarina halobia]|uniref:TAXI family TRAP transporter solute-binding subunit n=1 Tax=Halomarina halobia TaxID=3033386 RepID=A0ABD6AFX3_9EURY|nr:TAXI family TRAP transporter solute-binding subunit [Halomarina sp. PSR21]
MADRASGRTVDRRTVLRTLGVGGIAGVAGCLGGTNGGDGNGSGGGDGENGSGGGSGQYNWVIGTSSDGTTAHTAGVAFSEVVNEHSDMIQMSAQTSGGTGASLALMAQGENEAGTITTVLVDRANRSVAPFEDVDTTITQTFSYLTLDFHLMKREDAGLDGVETVNDIPPDTPMSWGQRQGTNFEVAIEAMELSGIDNPTEHFTDLRDIAVADQAEALREGRVDIIMPYTANLTSKLGWVQELDATVDIEPVNFTFSEEDLQNSSLPVAYGEISPDVWDQEVTKPATALVTGYLVGFPADTDEEAVYEFTKTILDNSDEVNEYAEYLEKLSPEFALEWLLKSENGPIHPGAERYYKENDLWSDDLLSLDDYED